MNNDKYNKYLDKNIYIKSTLSIIWWMILGVVFLTCSFLAISVIFSVFEGEEGAFETWITSVLVAIGTAYPAIRLLKKIRYMGFAIRFSRVLAQQDKPFIEIRNFEESIEEFELIRPYKNEMLSDITGAIKHGYLKNCTIEIHDGVPVIALEKKITIEKCPYCGAPVVGVYDNSYICNYCGSKIVNVIEKK